ncbi:MAG: metallopeptidase family protein, partial [Patescibacteria group bacterium]|nr:metallopeptidase family protein [Patescibacteria group bacterium]
MEEAEFEKLVKESILELPERIRQKIDNCALCIEKRPSTEQLRKTGIRYGGLLLGLYEGVPQTKWGRGFGMILPDKITIFQESIEKFARTP